MNKEKASVMKVDLQKQSFSKVSFFKSVPLLNVQLVPLITVLIILSIIFQVLTQGLFLSPRNLTNLSGQVTITAMLAAGSVLVMIPGYIDLSPGATVAASAVVAALASNVYGLSFWPTVGITLMFGLMVGAWHAFWVAWMRVPAFIVTLASLLAISGFSLLITNAETISPSPAILVIANASLTPILSVVVLLLFWVVFSFLQVREWRARVAAKIKTSFGSVVTFPVVGCGLVILGAIIVTAGYRGMPIPAFITLVVIAITGGLLRYASFGRRILAIGGNRQAAELAGINVRMYTSIVFIGMGLLYGVAGLVLVARLDSAPPNAESGLELSVIAAAVIGGTSLLGGRGTIAGAVLGAVLLEALANGMSLMNLPSAYQTITVGLVLLLAVYADVRRRRGRQLL